MGPVGIKNSGLGMLTELFNQVPTSGVEGKGPTQVYTWLEGFTRGDPWTPFSPLTTHTHRSPSLRQVYWQGSTWRWGFLAWELPSLSSLQPSLRASTRTWAGHAEFSFCCLCLSALPGQDHVQWPDAGYYLPYSSTPIRRIIKMPLPSSVTLNSKSLCYSS